jgi:hypothetical protein
VRDNRIHDMVPVKLVDSRETIRTALERLRQEQVDTCWFDGGGVLPPEWTTCGDADYAGGTVCVAVIASCWKPPRRRSGRPSSRSAGATAGILPSPLWRLRGMMDRAVGGPGLRRGRRHPVDLRVGDGLDFWRVVAVEPPRRLLLLAEMKAPGDALLEFHPPARRAGPHRLEMVARFLPRGLAGMAYWYALLPAHQWLFEGMLSVWPSFPASGWWTVRTRLRSRIRWCAGFEHAMWDPANLSLHAMWVQRRLDEIFHFRYHALAQYFRTKMKLFNHP